VQTEKAQLQLRVDRAIEVAAEMPNLDGLSLDRTELENLAQNVRVTGALLKEEIDHLVNEPDEQRAFSVYSLLTRRLAEVESVEQRARQLQEAVDTQLAGGPSKTEAPTAHDRVVSRLSDLMTWLKEALHSFWALISQLLTPREWTIGGKVGTGILGLTEVSASIKFGK
jgi:hypothetical protein